MEGDIETKAPFEDEMKRVSLALTGDEHGLTPEQYEVVLAVLHETYLHGRNAETGIPKCSMFGCSNPREVYAAEDHDELGYYCAYHGETEEGQREVKNSKT